MSHVASGRRPRGLGWSVAGALVCGLTMALQGRMNGGLAQALGQPIESALYSNLSGLAVLVTVLACVPRSRRALADTFRAVGDGRLRWWMLFAGVFGGFIIGVQSQTVPLLGVALFGVCVVAGQTVGALLVDALGLGPADAQPVTPARALAVLTCLGGVVLAAAAGGVGAVPWAAAALALAAGLGTSVQSAWNANIGAAQGSPVATTTLNFFMGASALAAFGLVRFLGGHWRPVPLRGPWWVWWGGLMGVIGVCIATLVVRKVGVLLFTLLSLLSQLVTALLLDVVAHVPGAASPQRLAGLAVTAAGAALAGWAAARARRQPGEASGA